MRCKYTVNSKALFTNMFIDAYDGVIIETVSIHANMVSFDADTKGVIDQTEDAISIKGG